MIRVGLTGGIASGKSAVAEEFARLGAEIIDSDILARAVVEPGSPAFDDIIERFGFDVLGGDGALDRAALGRIVFADEDARRDLNAIVHPWVRATARAIEESIDDPYAIVIHMIPLLVETGQAGNFDAVIVVDVDAETQLTRLIARNGLTREEAQARIDAQASREHRLAIANYVIRNDSTLDALAARVHAVWHDLDELGKGPRAGCGC